MSLLGLAGGAVARTAASFNRDGGADLHTGATDGAAGDTCKQCAGNQNKNQFQSHGSLNRRGHDDDGADAHLSQHLCGSAA